MKLLMSFVLGALAIMLAAPAHAQANLEINSPGVTALRQSLQQRFGELKPHLDSGAVGLTRDGNLALRDANAVPLQQRQQVNSLIAADNQDRASLYREIARANGHPEWEQDIRTTFGQRWIERAPAGWYYQTPAGTWARK